MFVTAITVSSSPGYEIFVIGGTAHRLVLSLAFQHSHSCSFPHQNYHFGMFRFCELINSSETFVGQPIWITSHLLHVGPPQSQGKVITYLFSLQKWSFMPVVIVDLRKTIATIPSPPCALCATGPPLLFSTSGETSATHSAQSRGSPSSLIDVSSLIFGLWDHSSPRFTRPASIPPELLNRRSLCSHA